jgi:iron complex outermembrane receptor protein
MRRRSRAGAQTLLSALLCGLGATGAAAQPATPPSPASQGPVRLSEEVVVQAVRAEQRTPVTKTDIEGEEIQQVNRGQEMPFLLGSTPSVNFQSDSGLAAGYTYFTIRGITQTRLNITLDGVPLQDPEDQALYFSAFGDFASVVDSVQVQRGVGTSSVGGASYGGSVNFASVSPSDQRGTIVHSFRGQ